MPRVAVLKQLDPHMQKEIIGMIAAGNTNTLIASKIGVNEASLRNYIKRYLLPVACKSFMTSTEVGAQDYLSRLNKILIDTEKMHNALLDWLEDPRDRTKLTMDPRDEEINCVVRMEKEDNKGQITTKRITVPLREVLAKCDQADFGDYQIKTEKFVWKNADPRKLMIESAKAQKDLLEVMAKITGELKESVDVHVDVSGQVASIVQIINRELADLPEARKKIVEAIDDKLSC